MAKKWQRFGGLRAWWRRVDWRVAAAYGAVVALIGLVLVTPPWGGDRAVPALARPSQAQPQSAATNAAVTWFWTPAGGPGLLRASMLAGMPVLAAVHADGETPPALFDPGTWLKRILGVNPFDLRSLLAAEVPGLKDPGPAEHGDEGGSPGAPAPPPQAQADITSPRPVVTGKDPLVAIYHTHAYESYASLVGLPAGADLRYAISNDNALNIVAVGGRLARDLAGHGVPVVHSEAHHGPQVGAYVRSRATATGMLKTYPSVQILFDVHRDSQPRSLTTMTLAGKPAARIMIVVAKGASNLKQPYYPKNLQFAQQVYSRMESSYPGLMRPIYQEPARYNQDLLPGALLFEVGGPENSLEEVYRSIDLLAGVLAAELKQGEFPRQR